MEYLAADVYDDIVNALEDDGKELTEKQTEFIMATLEGLVRDVEQATLEQVREAAEERAMARRRF